MKKGFAIGIVLVLLAGVLFCSRPAVALGEAPATVVLDIVEDPSNTIIGTVAIDPATYYPADKDHLGYPRYPNRKFSQGADCSAEYFKSDSGQAYFCCEKSVRAVTNISPSDRYFGTMRRVGYFHDDRPPSVADKLAAFFAYTENNPNDYTPFMKAGIVWALREQITLTDAAYIAGYHAFLNAYAADPNNKMFKGATVYRYEDVKTGGTYQDMITYTFEPHREEGGFAVRKSDGNGVLLDGAEFDLKRGETVVDHFIVPREGYTSELSFDVGDYALVETKAPLGHVADATPLPLTITDQAINRSYWDVPIENETVKGRIRIVKRESGTSLPIAGATFEVLNEDRSPATDADGLPVGALVSDEAGVALTPLLRYGRYIVRETSSPPGYEVNETEYEVIVDENDRTEELEILNEKIEIRVRAVKKDALTGEPLAGAVFQIIDASGEVVRFTTGEDGVGVAENLLPAGTYTMREIEAPPGYVPAGDLVFDISAETQTEWLPDLGRTKTFHPENEPIEVTFSKKEVTGESELPGARLQVIDPLTGRVIEEWISGQEAHVIRYLERDKTYLMRETVAPKGYAVTGDVSFTVRGDGSFEQVEMRDDVTHTKILKKDRRTEAPLDGVVFEIRDDAGALSFVYDEFEDIYVSAVLAVDQGTTVAGEGHETTAGEGHETTVAGGHETTNLTTDALGMIHILGIPAGDYVIAEIEEPPGYERIEQVVPITVPIDADAASPYVVEISNNHARFRVFKVDASDPEKYLAGAEFEFYRLEDGKDPVLLSFVLEGETYICDDQGEVSTLTTNEEGMLLIEKIPKGTYAIRETKAPEGYVLEDTWRSFVIGDLSDNPFNSNVPSGSSTPEVPDDIAFPHTLISVDVHEDTGERSITIQNEPVPPVRKTPQTGESQSHQYIPLFLFVSACMAVLAWILLTARKRPRDKQ